MTDERTVVRLTGTRNAAVILKSTAGEKIYLPPEDFAESATAPDGPGQSPYQPVDDGSYSRSGPADSPYDGVSPADSPYDGADDPDARPRADAEGGASREPTLGVESTPDGFRIVYPEPVYDVRVIR